MLEDSSPEKWEYREHTKVKHILLGKYLTAWIPILGRWSPEIRYFDGFAGRGEYTDGTLGSPIIALNTADKLAQYYDKLSCIFVERDKDNFNNLENVLAREKPNIRNLKKIEISTKNAEFATEISKYLEEKQNISAPSFFFIDPFGFSGVPFQIIKRILANPKTEVFLTFMVQVITRFIENHELRNTLTELLGTTEWTKIIGLPDREKALIEMYRKQLHEIAGVRFSSQFMVSASERFRTLYYLIHVTNHIKGHKIMKEIMFNQGAHGSFAYLGPRDTAERSQMRLFNIDDIDELKRYLLEKFNSRTLTYDEIQEKVCEPWHSEPPYIDSHYRQALKELEKEDKISARRVTSKTERGLGGEDLITFL